MICIRPVLPSTPSPTAPANPPHAARTIFNMPRPATTALSAPLLAFDKFANTSVGGSPKHTIAFLHGILGNKRNWQTPAKAFVKAMPDFVAVNIDHRGHGASVATKDSPATLRACATELREFFTHPTVMQDLGVARSHHTLHHPHDAHDKSHKKTIGDEHDHGHPHVPTVLCGHSFGGKVALAHLKHCVTNGLPLPAVTFVLDSLPGLFATSATDSAAHDASVRHILDSLLLAPATYPSKQSALDHLRAQHIAPAIVHWLAVNLVPIDPADPAGAVRFCFDIAHVHKLFADYCATDMWDFLFEFNRRTHTQEANAQHHSHHLGQPTTQSAGTSAEAGAHPSKIVFVRAGRNALWTDSVLRRFEDLARGAHDSRHAPHAGHSSAAAQRPHGNVSLVTMPHVGHWLHVDDMQGVVDLLVSHTRQHVR